MNEGDLGSQPSQRWDSSSLRARNDVGEGGGGWAWESERSGLVAERTKKTENI